MVRRRKKQQAPDGPPGAPEWIVTFTDMVSLLVTFFVLLMTFSSSNKYDALQIDAFLSAHTGTQRAGGFALADLPEYDLLTVSSLERGANRPHSRPSEKLPESLEEMGQKLTDGHVEVDFNTVRDGIVIEFGEEACFDPGSTDVNDELEKSLVDLGEVLENYPHLVVVEGHADGAFEPTPAHPTVDAMALSRARSAASILLKRSGMNPDLLQIASHGDRQARADNFSGSGRRLNRRVQIRVLALSKQRATHLEAQGTVGGR